MWPNHFGSDYEINLNGIELPQPVVEEKPAKKSKK